MKRILVIFIILASLISARAGVSNGDTLHGDLVLKLWTSTARIVNASATGTNAQWAGAATQAWWYATQPSNALGLGRVSAASNITITATTQAARVQWIWAGGADGVRIWRGSSSGTLTNYLSLTAGATNFSDVGTNAWLTGTPSITATNPPGIIFSDGTTQRTANAGGVGTINASGINVAGSVTNYSPVTNNVQAHLVAIDSALGSISVGSFNGANLSNGLNEVGILASNAVANGGNIGDVLISSGSANSNLDRGSNLTITVGTSGYDSSSQGTLHIVGAASGHFAPYGPQNGGDVLIEGGAGGDGGLKGRVYINDGVFSGDGAGLTNLPVSGMSFNYSLFAGSSENFGSTNAASIVGVTGSVNWTECQFSDTYEQYSRWTIPASATRNYAGGAITNRIEWYSTLSTTNSVVWSIAYRTIGTGAVMNAAYSTARMITNPPSATASGIVWSDIVFTPATNEIKAGQSSVLELRRKPTDANDTSGSAARMISNLILQ